MGSVNVAKFLFAILNDVSGDILRLPGPYCGIVMDDLEFNRNRFLRAQEIGWAALVAEEMGYSLPTSDVQEPKPYGPISRTRIVRAMSRMKKDGDRGVGDTVHRLLTPLGGRVFERWYARVMGRPCGCQDRRERLNAAFPYSLR